MATVIPARYENAERWAFGDTEETANQVAELILNGTKTATCSNLDEDGVPLAGDVFVVVDGQGDGVCAIELTSVELTTFEEVGAAHAAAEAEGDGSLAFWRKQQQEFFEAYDLFSPAMSLILMNFKVVDKF